MYAQIVARARTLRPALSSTAHFAYLVGVADVREYLAHAELVVPRHLDDLDLTRIVFIDLVPDAVLFEQRRDLVERVAHVEQKTRVGKHLAQVLQAQHAHDRFAHVARAAAREQQLLDVFAIEFFEGRIRRARVEIAGRRFVIEVGEKPLPQHLLAHLGAVARDRDAVAVNARHGLTHRIDRNFRKEPVPGVRHVRHQEIGVLVRRDVGMLAEHLQRNRRARARQAADVHRTVDFYRRDLAREYLRFEIPDGDECGSRGMDRPHAPIEGGGNGKLLLGRRRHRGIAIGHIRSTLLRERPIFRLTYLCRTPATPAACGSE